MSIAICLLVYGFTVAVLAPPLLRRLATSRAGPRTVLGAWVAVLGSVTAAWVFAPVILVADVLIHLAHPERASLVGACLEQLRDVVTGRYGYLAEAGLLVLATSAALASAVAVTRLGRILVRARSTTHEHARMVRIAGRHSPELDAVVLAVGAPAAYSVAGKHGTVVVTEGVIAALRTDQLAAVLAHERAHLDGRHHLLLAATRGLTSVFPRVRLFATGAAEVALLLETIADDAAARLHGPDAVLRALVTLSELTAGTTGGLGATGLGLPARADRLAAGARTAPKSRIRVRPTTTAMTIGPAAATLIAAVGIATCASEQVLPAQPLRPSAGARTSQSHPVPTLPR
ncbi:Zn-dependent protease with chaperone function [Nocardia transvalensis]|uniref:Zn-dependent protease with chaperone function n=1 Tax=Nocardia transvalensis TaxID=37333 RepID=A0A7W9ULI1_9NOCA|nr:M56 family metallopeptidase [Nocardia transvalensis]MBB5917387.1 Zn-dependent protease with chaperone function [Nocardia transvalensis]